MLQTPGAPTNPMELRALREKRGELSDQLVSATGRRNRLADELRTADEAARAGIEARMKVLDDRIIRLEQEIDLTGDQLANASPAAMAANSEIPPEISEVLDRVSNDLVPIVAILAVFVFAPFAIAISRFIWRRSTPAPRANPAIEQATQQKLDTLQQAVDTIAIEVERISEGQRFVTKVLSDRSLGAGAADPVYVGSKAAASHPR